MISLDIHQNFTLESVLYFLILFLLVLQRLSEMRLSRIHQKMILKKGGVEMFSGHFPFIFTLHIAWFIACFYMGMISSAFLSSFYFLLFVFLLIFCQIIRFVSIQSLGEYWNTKIYIIPNQEIVNRGIYSYIQHPNYAIVILELAIVPLLCHAKWTAMIFSCINAILLFIRIRAEECALKRMKNYDLYSKKTPRFFPKIR